MCNAKSMLKNSSFIINKFFFIFIIEIISSKVNDDTVLFTVKVFSITYFKQNRDEGRPCTTFWKARCIRGDVNEGKMQFSFENDLLQMLPLIVKLITK